MAAEWKINTDAREYRAIVDGWRRGFDTAKLARMLNVHESMDSRTIQHERDARKGLTTEFKWRGNQ